MKTTRWVVFGVMIVAQIAVPAYMILGREQVLNEGAVYKILCGPVDPYDPFRGRYVALAIRESTVDDWSGPHLQRGTTVYVRFNLDERGFARLASASTSPPAGESDYLEATVNYVDTRNKKLHVRLPFDRYYMEESQAPAAEAAYRDARLDGEDVYIQVRVRNGQGVIEGLYIDDVPVEQYLRDLKEDGV